jgi:hypoxanthine phosphoribosyltransferase
VPAAGKGEMMQDYKDILAEVLIDGPTLQKRVKELADDINRDYAGKQILLICILRGALPFMVDLMRHLTVLNAIDCMAVSSYGEGARESTGNVRMTLDLKTNIEDRHVILVEDIVDSGHTIAHVLQILRTRNPKSLKVCALLDKESRREEHVPIDYCGFAIANKFVFGYGLDLDEYYRNLPFVGVVDLDRYNPNG